MARASLSVSVLLSLLLFLFFYDLRLKKLISDGPRKLKFRLILLGFPMIYFMICLR